MFLVCYLKYKKNIQYIIRFKIYCDNAFIVYQHKLLNLAILSFYHFIIMNNVIM
jgi:hypothetical protein